MNWWI